MAEPLHCEALASQKRTPPGNTGLLLCSTVAVRVMGAPALTEFAGATAMVVVVGCGPPKFMVVTSEAESLPVMNSPPPETVAELVTEAAAFPATSTVRVRTG